MYLPNRDGHDVWVNSRALELAGITADTPEPGPRPHRPYPGRHPAGHAPRGRLGLGRAADPADHARRPGARPCSRASATSTALGITNWQDAWLTPTPRTGPTWRWPAPGELTARVVGAHWGGNANAASSRSRELVERRAGGRLGRFNATSVKLMVDGIVENYTGIDARAVPRRPRPRLRATAAWTSSTPSCSKQVVVKIDALGFQPHFHALGDRAVRQALDAVEAARLVNGWTDAAAPRAHPGGPPRRACPASGRLGALPNAQALWAVGGGPDGRSSRCRSSIGRDRRAPVPVPLAAPAWGNARDGLGLVGVDPQPPARDGGCGPPHLAPETR